MRKKKNNQMIYVGTISGFEAFAKSGDAPILQRAQVHSTLKDYKRQDKHRKSYLDTQED